MSRLITRISPKKDFCQAGAKPIHHPFPLPLTETPLRPTTTFPTKPRGAGVAPTRKRETNTHATA